MFWKKLAVFWGVLGCVGLVGAAKITLTFMTVLGGADGAFMDNIIAKFNEDYKDQIEIVHVVVVDSVQYKMKLSSGIATGTAPEVLFMRRHDAPAFLEHFRTWTTEELLSWGIDVSDIYPSLLEGLLVNSMVYGIPIDCWMYYMAYNRENFRKAGLDPDRPPANKEEFFAALEALKAITPEGITPYWATPSFIWRWLNYMWQFGGDILTPDYKAPAFVEAGIKATKFILEMQERGYFPTVLVTDTNPVFLKGASSILETGVWTLGQFRQVLGEALGVAPVAQIGPVKAVFAGSHMLALPGVMVKDPQIYKAAMTWIRYLWDHALDWYAAGQTPSRMSIATSEELKTKLPDIYIVAQQFPNVKTFPFFAYVSEILAEIETYVQKAVITKELTPEQAMLQAEEAVKDILADYWAGH